jgi:hypothetical protein
VPPENPVDAPNVSPVNAEPVKLVPVYVPPENPVDAPNVAPVNAEPVKFPPEKPDAAETVVPEKNEPFTVKLP